MAEDKCVAFIRVYLFNLTLSGIHSEIMTHYTSPLQKSFLTDFLNIHNFYFPALDIAQW